MAVNPEEIITLVQNLYAASGAGDFDRLADLLTEDFFVSEGGHLPMAGTYRGQRALQELFIKVMGLVDVAGLDLMTITASPDGTAIALVRMRFADPALAPAELCELFRFRDGKCCEIRPYYFDPAALHAAAAAKLAHHSA